MLMIKW